VSYKSVVDNDTLTVTTVNTQDSYLQDTISDLQNASQQHQQILDELQATNNRHQQLLTEHNTSLEEVDSNLKTHISNFNSHLATLEEEQQIQQRHHDKLQAESQQHSTKLQTLTGNIEELQKQ
jgi:chromosome segregation ATPase